MKLGVVVRNRSYFVKGDAKLVLGEVGLDDDADEGNASGRSVSREMISWVRRTYVDAVR